MPFDPSGNFTRDFNWQQDRDNGIRILASRMDGECDNFAQAFNVTFLRTGIVPMSGNLGMGQNYLTGLGAGNAAALSIRYGDDPTSGMFLNGIGKPSLVAGGTTRLEANATGVKVFGTLDSSGNLTEAGSRVWTAATLPTPVNSNNPVFTGIVEIDRAEFPYIQFTRTSVGNWFVGGSDVPGDNSFNFRFNAGATALAIQTNGNINIANNVGVIGGISSNGAINSGGALTQAGQQVWYAGNFDPSLKANLAAPTFTGGVAMTGTLAVNGAITQGGNLVWNTSSLSNPASLNGANFTGALQHGGNTVWDAGNFDPTLKANLASPALTGTPTANGNEVGTRDVPQSVLSAAFSFIASYRGGHVYYNGGAAAATIQPNSTTALPIGTAIAVVNDGSGVLTLTRGAGVALVFNNVNGDHALAVGGMATLLKVGTDRWFASGVGLS